jgi:hypothetical protein
MNFEIKTPALLRAMQLVESAMDELDVGTADIKNVNAKLNGARTIQNIVKSDVATRLAATRIHASEAKMIEVRPTAPQAITDRSEVAKAA